MTVLDTAYKEPLSPVKHTISLYSVSGGTGGTA